MTETLPQTIDPTQQFIFDAIRTESFFPDGIHLTAEQARLLHVGMGLVTEAGEFVDQLKKHIFYGKLLDLQNLDEEVGDGFWYAAIYHHQRAKSFIETMDATIRKLRARYPDKFTQECAIHRDTHKEMEAFAGNA